MQASGDAWVIYAAGSGWGHLTRALALAREASSKRPVTILSSSQLAVNILNSKAWHDFSCGNEINVQFEHSNNESFKTLVRNLLLKQDFSCLVVDTFPRGIIGELQPFFLTEKRARRVFVHRDITPEYVEEFSLRDYVRNNYALVINPGEKERPVLNDLAKDTNPWLIRNPDEIQEHECSRTDEHSDSELPMIIVCMSGKEEEQILFGKIAQSILNLFPQVQLRCLAAAPLEQPELEKLRIDYWPGMDVLNSADLVIGAAGYNTINECAALNVPLIACPLKRKYDRQLERSLNSSAITASTLEQVIEHTRLFLKNRTSRTRRKAHQFKNGAREAVQLIEALL